MFNITHWFDRPKPDRSMTWNTKTTSHFDVIVVELAEDRFCALIRSADTDDIDTRLVGWGDTESGARNVLNEKIRQYFLAKPGTYRVDVEKS